MIELKERITDKIDNAGAKAKAVTDKVAGIADEVREKEQKASVTGIIDAVKEKVKDAAAGATDLAGKAKEKVEDWASATADAAGHAKDKAQEVATAAVHKAEDLGHEVTKLIQRYPVQALLVGFGIGLLLAKITRHRD
jgi:ElaB/YqjD/DUF883 family membrane-anchored ribosome-binding protein